MQQPIGELRLLIGHTGAVNGIAFSPDGKTIATGSDDKTARLWSATTGEHIATLTGHTDDVKGVAFSPDGNTIATGSYDKTVRLWDAKTAVHTSEHSQDTGRGFGLYPLVQMGTLLLLCTIKKGCDYRMALQAKASVNFSTRN